MKNRFFTQIKIELNKQNDSIFIRRVKEFCIIYFYLQLMSSQLHGTLQMTQSYNFNRDSTNNFRGRSIDPSGFYAWTKDNMYKSSYAKFHSSNSVQPKNMAVPGYAGFVPAIKAQNIHGKGFTNMTKTSFSNDKLAKNIHGLATTGLNINKEVFIDQSKFGSSSKYGKSALQRPHPNWNNPDWRTTTQDAFRNPNHQVNPTFKETDKHLESRKQSTKNSGFAMNYSLCDGKGWRPDPILKGDINRSEYRDRFNEDKPFHRNTFMDKIRKIKAKEVNYRYN